MYLSSTLYAFLLFFFFQAEDGIRDLVRSRGLGDVYKRQPVAPGLYEMMAELCADTPIPIALDEDLIGLNTHDAKVDLLDLSLIHI